jgi:hypothetical protein
MILARNHGFEKIRLGHRRAKTLSAQPSDSNYLRVLFETTPPKSTQDSNDLTAF